MYFIIRPSSVSGRIVSCAEEVTSVKIRNVALITLPRKQLVINEYQLR